MLASPTRNANGFCGILGGELSPLSPNVPRAAAFNETFKTVFPPEVLGKGFPGTTWCGAGEILSDILFLGFKITGWY